MKKSKDLKTEILTIRLEHKYVVLLRKKARSLGMGASTLARMWILEKLHEEQSV